ncbi:hypothetical protein ACF0H5_021258 [Mactra antiquata]
MRVFVFLAVLVTIVAVVQGNRRSRSPQPDVCMKRGHIGTCLGVPNLACQAPGTTCIPMLSGTGGLCCVNPGRQCQGQCDGIEEAICQEGYECVYRQWSSLGDCCRRIGVQGRGYRRTRDPQSRPDVCMTRGHIGTCLGVANSSCQSPETTCTPMPSGTDGLCCVNQGRQCRGTCGGFAGALCPQSYTCIYRLRSSLGDCCKYSGRKCQGRCGGFAGASCQHGYECIERPGYALGDCCEPIGQQCQGTCGGFAGAFCQQGYECIERPGYSFGDCCEPIRQCPPPSGEMGTCDFDLAVNCLDNSDCQGGKICCPEGCGKECKNPMPNK